MKESFLVHEADADLRLDAFLVKTLPDYTREKIRKAIKAGHCTVDGQIKDKPALRIHSGQEIQLTLARQEEQLVAEAGEIPILWQDADVLVCNKPAGLTVHPCPSCPEHTLIQKILRVFPQLQAMGGLRPGIVHRLDKETSGLLVVALSEAVRLALTQAFAQRQVYKEYLALVKGAAPESGECLEPIGRHPTAKIKMCVSAVNKGGKTARTEWRRLWLASDRTLSLLAVRIYTGRTHQIRVHLAHLGYPLLGDKVYGSAQEKQTVARQMLHSWKLALKHPVTGQELRFVCPPPADFVQAACAGTRCLRRVVLTGNPGSGKSTVLALLAEKNFPVFSADQEVKKLYAAGSPLLWQLRHYFGDAILQADGAVNKVFLYERLVHDTVVRREIETVVHGLVKEALQQFWQEARGAKFAFAEVPLYLECGWPEEFCPRPLSVYVRCEQSIRFKRIAENRGWTQEKIETLESWQWPEAKKEVACDFVVANSQTQEALVSQVEQLLAALATVQKKEENLLLQHLSQTSF